MIIHLPILAKLFGKRPYGITLFFVITLWGDFSARAIAHEKCHVQQWRSQPFTFHLRYFCELLKNKWSGLPWYAAYKAISYEKEAREWAQEIGIPH